VIGPTFKFDVEVVDFGLVSYTFSHSRSVVLTNTSEIPMTYTLAIPQDGAFVGKREFTVSPAGGTLQPGASQVVALTLTSTTVKAYDYVLSVDVAGVGKGLLSMPILADCRVATVEVKTKQLDYGECFIRFPYELELVLANTSAELKARFAVVPQEPATKGVAEFVAEPSEGTIQGGQEGVVRIRLVSVRLGQFRLPLQVTIAGSVLPPISATLLASVRGPRLVLDPSAELNWGPTECLFDVPRTLTLTNDSDIPAPYKAFVKSSRSKFRLDAREGVLAPREALAMTVTAHLDDTIVHRDTLHLLVAEGDNQIVNLLAKGTGTTIFCHEVAQGRTSIARRNRPLPSLLPPLLLCKYRVFFFSGVLK
jgi:hydrocephalus-inducing protein